MLLWVKLVCKNLTQTQTNGHIFLPCLLVLFSHKVYRQCRCSPELFHSRGFIPGQNPRRCRTASVSLQCNSTTDNNIEPIIYTIYTTVDADSKVMPRYISDVQMYSTLRCFWQEGQMDFPIITSHVTPDKVAIILKLTHDNHAVKYFNRLTAQVKMTSIKCRFTLVTQCTFLVNIG